jgi:hypothetical protein
MAFLLCVIRADCQAGNRSPVSYLENDAAWIFLAHSARKVLIRKGVTMKFRMVCITICLGFVCRREASRKSPLPGQNGCGSSWF